MTFPTDRTTRSRRSRRLAAGAAVAAAAVGLAAGPAWAGDTPAGFYFGGDSMAPAGTGSAPPYRMDTVGGLYGGYVAEVGTWTDWTGCTQGTALNSTAVAHANADERYKGTSSPPGVFYYWFAAGPGADPHYDGTDTEAYAWGKAQAVAAVADYQQLVQQGYGTDTPYTPLMFMDVEGGAGQGQANGWNEVTDSCGDITRQVVIPVSADRSTFNGFWDYLANDTIFHPGVYSTASYWAQTFGTGPDSHIPNTYEWTANWPGNVTPAPVGFCQGSSCAQWFGALNADREAGWQWYGGSGDFDQWDTANLPGA